MPLKVEQGLAISRVDDIVCDKQNIIWIKSNRGLQFWDGQRIETFKDSTLSIGSKYQIYPHEEEGILVTSPGMIKQVVFRGLNQTLIYNEPSPVEDFIPIPLLFNGKSNFLIHPDSILYADPHNEFKTKFVEKKPIGESSQIFHYSIDGNEYLIDFQMHTGILIKLHLIENINSIFKNLLPNRISIDDDELICSTKTGLISLKNSTVSIYPYPDQLVANYYSSLLKISDNSLLVGIDNALYEFNTSTNKWNAKYKNIDQNDLIQTGYFDKLVQDRYNNIWAITVSEGLLKIYNDDSFTYFGSSDKKLNFVKNIVADEKENRIIAAALDGGILVYDTLGNQILHLDAQNTNGQVKSVTGIYKIKDNEYIYNNHLDSLIYGLSFKNEKAVIQSYLQKQETYLYYQDAIQIDDNSSLLLFNRLYHLQHSPLKLDTLFHHIATKPCMISDSEHIWIGCNDGLIKYRLGDGDQYQKYTLPGEGYVRSISKWKNQTLALGTDKGLSIFNTINGQLTSVDEGCIYCLLTDDDNNIWAGTGHGIIKYDPKFNKTHYSRIDGLQNNEFNTNACIKSASGKMYFGGLNGITSFDPNKVSNKVHGSNFYIKELSSGNKNLVKNAQLNRIQNFELPYNDNNLSMSVGTIGKYESGTYNYQYFVEGVSTKWVDAKHQTKYNFNLSPGEYKFHFLASNSFIPNAPLKNPLLISIENPWWKQWWFYLVSILSLIGIITYFIRVKEKQKYLRKKFEWDLAYQRQEDRMQMSKELHDNIGSRLTFLVSSIENIKKAFQTNSPQAIDKIDRLTDFGKDTIEDLRSMMWILNQQSITLQDLQLKILDYLNIAKNSYRNIDFPYEGPQNGLEFNLDSKLSQDIFRVIQEAIHNSVKHANPNTIAVNMVYKNQKIKISIEDDGTGFDLENTQNGNGLNNMKSRLSEHGCVMIISSNQNQGTILRFEVDLHKNNL